MCGICGVFGLDKPSASRARVLALSKRQRHRGPDWSGCFVGKDAILAHERLAIVGVGEWRPLQFVMIQISDYHRPTRYGRATTRQRRWQTRISRQRRNIQSHRDPQGHREGYQVQDAL